ncbi:MAG: TIGR04282 family arsenosugar biosynthesis glycosyltransferase [Pseudomonadota bacterium]
MVKAPRLGWVKTRLGRDVGAVAATGFYRHAAASVIGRLSGHGRWRTVLAVAPDRELGTRQFPRGRLRMAQGQGDLGDRLAFVTRTLPPGPAVVIGTDIPGITARDIANAFAALGGHDGVLGPAPDGGYWLVGLKRSPDIVNPFRTVRWSSEHAFADTLRNFGAGRKVARLRTLADVDDGATYAQAASWSGRRVLPPVNAQQVKFLR